MTQHTPHTSAVFLFAGPSRLADEMMNTDPASSFRLDFLFPKLDFFIFVVIGFYFFLIVLDVLLLCIVLCRYQAFARCDIITSIYELNEKVLFFFLERGQFSTIS